MKIKAPVLREAGKPVAIETLELDTPKANEVLVKNVNCGWCHSDYSLVKGHISTAAVPMTVGHEAAGIVEAVGPGVTSVQVGDHVASTWMTPCGKCKECISGRGYICSGCFPPLLGGTMLDGTRRLTDSSGNAVSQGLFASGFASHAVVPESGVIKVSKSLPLEHVCLLGCCVPTGWGAVTNVAKVHQSDSVAIWGMGGVGLNIVRAAAARKAYPIIAVDIQGSKEKIAREFGATHFINSSKMDPVPMIQQELTAGGADFCFEAIGDPGSYVQAYWSLGPGGSLIAVGITPESVSTEFPLFIVPFQARSIKGTLYGNVRLGTDIPRFAKMMESGELKLEHLVTKRFKVEELNDVIDAMENNAIEGRWVCDLD